VPFRFASDEHQEDPALTRESVRRLLDRPLGLLCPAHGPPELVDGTAAMREALERDAREG
jgi:glyoxylase-like metal-dependent hydrolase (beta-lactamase superfamily II)